MTFTLHHWSRLGLSTEIVGLIALIIRGEKETLRARSEIIGQFVGLVANSCS